MMTSVNDVRWIDRLTDSTRARETTVLTMLRPMPTAGTATDVADLVREVLARLPDVAAGLASPVVLDLPVAVLVEQVPEARRRLADEAPDKDDDTEEDDDEDEDDDDDWDADDEDDDDDWDEDDDDDDWDEDDDEDDEDDEDDDDDWDEDEDDDDEDDDEEEEDGAAAPKPARKARPTRPVRPTRSAKPVVPTIPEPARRRR